MLTANADVNHVQICERKVVRIMATHGNISRRGLLGRRRAE
ncbi:Pectate lyase superfamily protein domain-containing protein OS=Streptomyces microflavus OX=1919 GN=HUT09_19025 PE=4 SV=1 [Streptomyces microflavus]